MRNDLTPEQKARLEHAQKRIYNKVNDLIGEDLVEVFPEAMTGNTDPPVEINLKMAVYASVDDWVFWNVPGYGFPEED